MGIEVQQFNHTPPLKQPMHGLGPNPGVNCVLPFIYRGVKEETCTLTDADDGRAWCSTLVDTKGRGHISFCNPPKLHLSKNDIHYPPLTNRKTSSFYFLIPVPNPCFPYVPYVNIFFFYFQNESLHASPLGEMDNLYPD